jgi:hypothetical protein
VCEAEEEGEVVIDSYMMVRVFDIQLACEETRKKNLSQQTLILHEEGGEEEEDVQS